MEVLKQQQRRVAAADALRLPGWRAWMCGSLQMHTCQPLPEEDCVFAGVDPAANAAPCIQQLQPGLNVAGSVPAWPQCVLQPSLLLAVWVAHFILHRLHN
jgi:hypothetical protein